MRLAVRLLLAFVLGLGACGAATDPKRLLIEQKLNGFTDGDYAAAVERLLTEHEARTGLPLRPGSLRKCGLKVSSDSGLGLSTPKPLVRAVGSALRKRGFATDAVIVCDGRQESMRQCSLS